ncbi:hypothetical protein WBG99_34265 [Streptomyces sp. TG1A-60]|uniref:hypothetical protein n=1 Tax=Streptomyces sp. TG1A-60 TaxID=3129111 RepID=UPI0030CD20D8
MELPLVVGLGGLDSSLRAVDRVADEATRDGLPSRVVHASLREGEKGEKGSPPCSTKDRPARYFCAARPPPTS